MASFKSFLPSADAKLLEWSATFNAQLTATPVAFGMTAAQATNYAALHTAFSTALATATNPLTRTKANVRAKDVARDNLKTLARSFGGMIQLNVAVTDAQKIGLGLNVRAIPAPVPVPGSCPRLTVMSVSGRTVSVKLSNNESSKRGRPAGVQGATVFSYVGANPPEDVSKWQFQGNTTRQDFDVQFDPTVAPGAKVYLCAFWYNPRAESGPACEPVPTYLQGGTMAMAA